MSNEEYLRACGWSECEGEIAGRWMRPAGRGRPTALLPFAEALDAQLAEDRARYNFVRERSIMLGGMLTPKETP